LSRQGKFGKWGCKKLDSCASADSPIDFVTVAGFVTVPKI